MAVIGWVDTTTITDLWADAPNEGPELTTILSAAYDQCLAYAPPWPLDPDNGEPVVTVTESLKLAQILQAQHLWARSKAGNGDSFGADGYMVQTWPLVMESRQLLRPKLGNPFAGLL